MLVARHTAKVKMVQAGKPQFTVTELFVLIDKVDINWKVLFPKLKNSVTNTEKKKIWQEVTEKGQCCVPRLEMHNRGCEGEVGGLYEC